MLSEESIAASRNEAKKKRIRYRLAHRHDQCPAPGSPSIRSSPWMLRSFARLPKTTAPTAFAFALAVACLSIFAQTLIPLCCTEPLSLQHLPAVPKLFSSKNNRKLPLSSPPNLPLTSLQPQQNKLDKNFQEVAQSALPSLLALIQRFIYRAAKWPTPSAAFPLPPVNPLFSSEIYGRKPFVFRYLKAIGLHPLPS